MAEPYTLATVSRSSDELYLVNGDYQYLQGWRDCMEAISGYEDSDEWILGVGPYHLVKEFSDMIFELQAGYYEKFGEYFECLRYDMSRVDLLATLGSMVEKIGVEEKWIKIYDEKTKGDKVRRRQLEAALEELDTDLRIWNELKEVIDKGESK